MHIRELEELSLNHWQPLSTLLLDGWILRFADGYTKRANSIQPISPSTWDLDEKIAACEQLYQENGLPIIFKISPAAQPEDLDQRLEARGYDLVDVVSVQVAELEGVSSLDAGAGAAMPTEVRIEEQVSGEWIERFRRMSQIPEKHRLTMERMLANIRTKKGFATVFVGDEAVACGLGVIERGMIGLYDIVTDERYRRQGFARMLVLNLMQWGLANGANRSYLQVIANNLPAWQLYASLGYQEVYQYWFRVKS